MWWLTGIGQTVGGEWGTEEQMDESVIQHHPLTVFLLHEANKHLGREAKQRLYDAAAAAMPKAMTPFRKKAVLCKQPVSIKSCLWLKGKGNGAGAGEKWQATKIIKTPEAAAVEVLNTHVCHPIYKYLLDRRYGGFRKPPHQCLT